MFRTPFEKKTTFEIWNAGILCVWPPFEFLGSCSHFVMLAEFGKIRFAKSKHSGIDNPTEITVESGIDKLKAMHTKDYSLKVLFKDGGAKYGNYLPPVDILVYRTKILQITKYPHRLQIIFWKLDFSVQRTSGTHFGNKNGFWGFWEKNSFVSLFEPKYTKYGETLLAERSAKLFCIFWYIQICTHMAHFRKYSYSYQNYHKMKIFWKMCLWVPKTFWEKNN